MGPRAGLDEMEKWKFCSCLYNFFKFFFKEMRYLMIYCSILFVNEIGIDIIFVVVESAKNMHVM
jgi:hypothetical protein